MIKGKTLKEAKDLSKKAVADALDGLPKEKMHCSNLGADALAKAIEDYEIKMGKIVPESVAKIKRMRENVPNPLRVAVIATLRIRRRRGSAWGVEKSWGS